MSWRTVAKKDLYEAYRGRSALVVGGLFLLLFAFLGYDATGPYSDRLLVESHTAVSTALWVLVPLLAVAFGYDAIAGGRESGSLRLVLAYPHSRRDVFVGSLVGRLTLVCGFVLAGVALAVGTFTAFGGGEVGPLASLVTLNLLYAVAAVCLVVGVSGAVRSGKRAIAGALGLYVLFAVGWRFLLEKAMRAVYGREFSRDAPDLFFALENLSFFRAYESARDWFLSSPDRMQYVTERVAENGFGETRWFALLVLAAWPTLLVAFGLWRFRRADV